MMFSHHRVPNEGEVMAQQILPNGTTLGERFRIDKVAGPGDLGVVYKALDTKANKMVALRVIPVEMLGGPNRLDELKQRVREASQLKHRNIRATFGMGMHQDSEVFVASEWIEGHNLRTLLDKRKETGKRFSFKGAYNIIGHVCNALTYAHERMHHGSLSPRAIIINSAGRVKVCDFGLSLIRTQIKSFPGRQKTQAQFWAPEVLSGKEAEASVQADVFSVGALFYELITGVVPKRPLKAPSQLGFTKEVDQVIASCMAAEPSQRYADAASIKSAIQNLVTTEEDKSSADAPVDDNLGIDIDIDMTEETDDTEDEPSFDAEPSMLNAPDLPPPPNGDGPRDSAISTIDMGELLSGLSSSETERWMVQKDKFDHGPFTDRELVQMILLGEVLGSHQLLNMDTGVRKKVRAWGDFDPYLERYRLKKKAQEEQAALERTKKAETRGTIGSWLIASIVVGVIFLGAGVYFLQRSIREEKVYSPEGMLAAFDSGEIKLKSGANLINYVGKKGKGKRRRGGKGGGGAGGGMFVDGMSYEDAMNMGVELGSIGDNAGQKQLTPETITHIMDRNVRKFLPCMAGETVKKVEMNIAIAGDGRVMGVSVAQGGPKLQKCVTSKVRSIKFPTSPAPRTAASWYFEIY